MSYEFVSSPTSASPVRRRSSSAGLLAPADIPEQFAPTLPSPTSDGAPRERPPVRVAASALALPREHEARLSPAFAPVDQRLKDVDGLLGRAIDGKLDAHQITIPKVDKSLSMDGLIQLAAGLKRIGNPTGTPIPEGLANGTARIRGRSIHLPALAIGDGSGRSIARGIAAMHPKDIALQLDSGAYQVRARLNPWIEIAHGSIIGVDETTRWNQPAPAAHWQYVTYDDLARLGVTARGSALVGQGWPPVLTPAASPSSTPAAAPSAPTSAAYSVPSATFDPTAMPAAFKHLTIPELPSLAHGQAWTRSPATNLYEIWRNPAEAPTSPRTNVDARTIGGRLAYTSFIPDPTHAYPDRERVLSGYAQPAPPKATNRRRRRYPMQTRAYISSMGFRFGRGHVVDHADGDSVSTSSAHNFVPQNPDFNSGARNIETMALRRANNTDPAQPAPASSATGFYLSRFDYPSHPTRTLNDTAIPTMEHFFLQPAGASPLYYAVDNLKYPRNRSRAAAAPYLRATPFPVPAFFSSSTAPGPRVKRIDRFVDFALKTTYKGEDAINVRLKRGYVIDKLDPVVFNRRRYIVRKILRGMAILMPMS